LDLSLKKGLNEPLFSQYNGFNITIWRPSAVKREQEREHVREHVKEHVINRELYITIDKPAYRLVWVLNGEMSRTEIMDLLELKGRRNFSEKYLTPALKNDWIEMTYPKSPKSPKQKYRLTTKGLKLKKNISG